MAKHFLLSLLYIMLSMSCQDMNDQKVQDGMGIKDTGQNSNQTPPRININLFQVTPAQKYMKVNETQQFYASGGEGPYLFAIESGGGNITAGGLFTAPPTPSTTTIIAIDQEGKTAYGIINVSAQLIMSPQSKVMAPSASFTFSASGGFPPYSYAVVTGGGSINPTTGLFVAPALQSSTIVRAQDSFGNEAFAAVSTTPSMVVTPVDPKVGLGETIAVEVIGGVPPITYTLLAGIGTLTTNFYTAPLATTGTAIVRVQDNLGSQVDVLIDIVDRPKIDQRTPKAAKLATRQLTVSGGTAPFTWDVIAGTGSIDPNTGLFTAPNVIGPNIVEVTDATGLKDTVSLEVFKPMIPHLGNNGSCFQVWQTEVESKVRCFGFNSDTGQYSNNYLGVSNPFVGDEPNEMGDNLRITDLGTGFNPMAIIGGFHHACAIADDYKIKCWGYNVYGQLGQGDNIYKGTMPSTSGDAIPETILGTGRTLNQTVEPDKAMAAGEYHTCAILDNNRVKCWGYSAYGATGFGSTGYIGDGSNERGDGIPYIDLGAGVTAKKIDSHRRHTCVIQNDDSVKCWGYNAQGQLGQGHASNRGHSAAWIPANYANVNLGTGLTAKDIAVGIYHTCVILNNDGVKCWGYNAHGELGYGDNINRGTSAAHMGDNLPYVDLGVIIPVKIKAGYYHTCIESDLGQVYCWGYGIAGRLGNGSTADIGKTPGSMGALTAIDFGTGRTVKQWEVNWAGGCAILDDDSVKCWGAGGSIGINGVGNTSNIGETPISLGDFWPTVDLGTGIHATGISAKGTEMNCAIGNDKKVRCWGANYYGKLGNGKWIVNKEAYGEFPESSLSGRRDIKEFDYHTQNSCARYSDDTIKCAGRSFYWQLGYGSNRFPDGTRADNSFENHGYYQIGGTGVLKDFAITVHAIAMMDTNDEIRVWGFNQYGTAGQNSNTPYWGSTDPFIGSGNPAVDLGTVPAVKAIHGGVYNFCAEFVDKTLKCWGYNAHGNLGIESTDANHGDQANEMGDNLPFVKIPNDYKDLIIDYAYHSCYVGSDDQLYCWGYNNNGQLGIGSTANIGRLAGEMTSLQAVDLGTGLTIKKVGVGGVNTCVLFTNNKMKCFGDNGSEQLGIPGGDRGKNPGELGDALPFIDTGSENEILDFDMGWNHVCVVLDDNSAKCWGSSQYNNLGYGDNINRGAGAGEMGDNLPKLYIGN
jgi:alpha-tubulin suppressor-like RCC1 family protein